VADEEDCDEVDGSKEVEGASLEVGSSLDEVDDALVWVD
jgi:hypothetical protein